MPLLSLPIGPDGYVLDVLVGLPGHSTAALVAAGQRVPAPLAARGTIDTGTNISGVAAALLQRLALSSVLQSSTQTIAGSLTVNLFEVSLSLISPAGVLFTHPQLTVMELPHAAADEVLIGRDILDAGLLVGHGPGQSFTLAF
jgi:filamentous hemagglutinin family protein